MFSLEMGANRLIDRIIISVTKIDADRVRNGSLKDEQWERIKKQAVEIAEWKITIDDSSGQTLQYIKNKASILKRKGLCDMVIIDYLGLMDSERVGGRNREQEVANISKGCKGMAKCLNIPVMLLSQLSRDVEKRGGEKVPILADLRESGAIEQDADMVIFMHLRIVTGKHNRNI